MYAGRLLILGALFLLALPPSSVAQAGGDIAKRTLDSGIAFYRSGDYKQALQDFNTVINAHPDSEWVDEALMQVARYYYEVERDVDGARERLQQIMQSHAASNSTPEAYYYLGYLLFDARRSVEEMRDGLANLERVVRLFPESEVADDALYTASVVHTALGDYELALEKLQILLLQFPESELRDRVQFAIGDAFMLMDDVRQAMVEFQQVRNAYPESPIAGKALDRLTLLYRLHFSLDAGLKPFSQDADYGYKGSRLDDPTYLLVAGVDLLVADRGLNRIIRAPIDGGSAETVGSSRPDAIDVAPDGRVISLANRQLFEDGQRLDLVSPRPGAEPEPLSNIEAFAIGPQGQYYVWDRRLEQIISYKTDFSMEKAYPSGVYDDIRDMAVDRLGNFLVLDGRGKKVVKYDPDGQRLVSMGPGAGASELRDPQYICVDDANNVYVLDRRLRSVIVYSHLGEYTSSFAFGESPRDPRGLAVDSTGAVYIADRRNHTVIRFK